MKIHVIFEHLFRYGRQKRNEEDIHKRKTHCVTVSEIYWANYFVCVCVCICRKIVIPLNDEDRPPQ